MIVWRFAGFYMLLLLVGLQGISSDVYEAARVDGANRWQTFSHVTLPLLKSSLALCTILCITGSLLAFDQFYILTRGGPDNSTITIVQLVYNVAFGGRNDLGVAAALSLVVLLALIVINAAQFRALRGEARTELVATVQRRRRARRRPPPSPVLTRRRSPCSSCSRWSGRPWPRSRRSPAPRRSTAGASATTPASPATRPGLAQYLLNSVLISG